MGGGGPSAGKPFGQTLPGEKHLANIRQLTFGGENAEAYFSFDGKQADLPVEARAAIVRPRIYLMDMTTGVSTRFSNGEGRTTCSYFLKPTGRVGALRFDSRWLPRLPAAR